jgi:hypothetical protein
MIMTPWFRAARLQEGKTRSEADELSGVGSDKLLTPKELENKTFALLGLRWGEDKSVTWDYSDGTYTKMMNEYWIYYGGIDSVGIKERARQLTTLMINVAQIQATVLPCPAVLLDFARPDTARMLFGGIDRNITPATGEGDTSGELLIKAKLVELHEKFLGQRLAVNDADILDTYDFLVESWNARKSREDPRIAQIGYESCVLNAEQQQWYETDVRVADDPNFMMGTWTDVLSYLMLDFDYLHE